MQSPIQLEYRIAQLEAKAAVLDERWKNIDERTEALHKGQVETIEAIHKMAIGIATSVATSSGKSSAVVWLLTIGNSAAAISLVLVEALKAVH